MALYRPFCFKAPVPQPGHAGTPQQSSPRPTEEEESQWRTLFHAKPSETLLFCADCAVLDAKAGMLDIRMYLSANYLCFLLVQSQTKVCFALKNVLSWASGISVDIAEQPFARVKRAHDGETPTAAILYTNDGRMHLLLRFKHPDNTVPAFIAAFDAAWLPHRPSPSAAVAAASVQEATVTVSTSVPSQDSQQLLQWTSRLSEKAPDLSVADVMAGVLGIKHGLSVLTAAQLASMDALFVSALHNVAQAKAELARTAPTHTAEKAVAIVSCKTCIAHDKTGDNTLLYQALRNVQAVAHIVDWRDTSVDWHQFSVAVLRTPWDYHTRRDEFLAWIASLERAGCRLFNNHRIIVWNTHKRYLADLERAGIPIVPTEFVSRNTAASAETLASIAARRGWSDVVVKPCVSASADKTTLVPHDALTTAATEENWQRLVREDGDVMVQPFVRSIRTEGELSLIFFNGRFSHCARKLPARKEGCFCVQEHLGGSMKLEEHPSEAALALAERVLAAQFAIVPERPLYARVDMFFADDATTSPAFMLSELEVTEPSLYHNLMPQSAAVFATEIKAFLTSS